MAMDDALDLAHFKSLLEQRAAELDRLLGDAESRSQSVELDQSKVGRLSRMDALQQQAMNDAIRSRAQHERVRLQVSFRSLARGGAGLLKGIPQAEGVTFDDEGYLYVVSEPNLFYRFVRETE